MDKNFCKVQVEKNNLPSKQAEAHKTDDAS